MTAEEITDTHQMDFGFESHGFGAVGIAAKSISEGKTVSFIIYQRPDKTNSTRLSFVSRRFFGLVEIEDGNKAFRVNSNSNLDGNGSHSLIASWYGNDVVSDPVFIAARLVNYLQYEGSDYFIKS